MEEIDPSALSAIQSRLDGICDWIANDAPSIIADAPHIIAEHLDPNAPERAYWHDGYQTALRDVMVLIREIYGK